MKTTNIINFFEIISTNFFIKEIIKTVKMFPLITARIYWP